MKLRSRPGDFLVTELTRYALDPAGSFALYRLEKRDIGTLEAVAELARAARRPPRMAGFGGLKDRHATTTQVVSLPGGPAHDLRGGHWQAAYLGQACEPITNRSFAANRFEIVVRDLGELPDIEALRASGVPNYFDDQRMGSLRGGSGEFIGRALVRGNYELALRLALASPSDADRKRARALEAAMHEGWGDWKRLARELPPSLHRRVAALLAARPEAFGFAFELLERHLRVLYLSAYQSYLWNRTLGELVAGLPDTFRVGYAAGEHVFWRRLGAVDRERFAALRIPFAHPSVAPQGEVGAALGKVLESEGVELRQFRLKRCRNTFFSRGERAALVIPEGLAVAGGADDRHPGRALMKLSFELPRGAYATIVLKRVFARGMSEAGAEPATGPRPER